MQLNHASRDESATISGTFGAAHPGARPPSAVGVSQTHLRGGRVPAEDKRRHERRAIALDVTFDNGTSRIRARSSDLSLGGMFIVTTEALPYESEFAIEVASPTLHAPLTLKATVRWSTSGGMGVQWGELRSRDAWAINQLLKG